GLTGSKIEMLGGGDISTTTGAGDFMGLFTGHSSVEAKVTQFMTVSGTLSDFRVSIDAAPASNKGLRYTVRKNGLATVVTCEIDDTSSPDTSCADTTNTVS